MNKNKVALLVCNRDTGKISKEFLQAVNQIGMFKMQNISQGESDKAITAQMNNGDTPFGYHYTK